MTATYSTWPGDVMTAVWRPDLYGMTRCQQRGYHSVFGAGCGTSEGTMLWSGACSDCGTLLHHIGGQA